MSCPNAVLDGIPRDTRLSSDSHPCHMLPYLALKTFARGAGQWGGKCFLLMHTIVRRWAAFLGAPNTYLHMSECWQTSWFLKIRCLSQGPCFSLHRSHALPVCAALSRVSQLTAVTPKEAGLGWCKRLLMGCIKATGMGIGSDLRVGEWRKTLFFFLCFQSSIRASRGTIGGYFLAGRSMTWWPVSEMHPSLPHGSKAIPDVRTASLVRGPSPYVFWL